MNDINVKSLCFKTHKHSLHGTRAKNRYVSDPVNSRFKTDTFFTPSVQFISSGTCCHELL